MCFAPAKFWKCEVCLTLPPVCCPSLCSYPVRFADAFAACLCQTCFFWWSAVVSKVTCGAPNVWQGKLAERACLCMCLRSNSPAVVPRLRTTTTTSRAMSVRSSSHFRSVLIWAWTMTFEGAAICVYARLTAAHTVGTSCWALNVVLKCRDEVHLR